MQTDGSGYGDKQPSTAGTLAADGIQRSEQKTREIRFGLSVKLLLTTIICIMVIEVFIYAPSVANFRMNWLEGRMKTAAVAATALSSEVKLADETKHMLLDVAKAKAIIIKGKETRQLISVSEMPPEVDEHIDLHKTGPLAAIISAFDVLLAGDGRTINIVDSEFGDGRILELIIDETPLRQAMLDYSRNILILSLLISTISATLVYVVLRWLFVRPLLQMGKSMAWFALSPTDPQRLLTPSQRRDEIGEVETHLRAMQSELSDVLVQQKRLADLGLAVSKINHELRNMLTSAQLFSDRLQTVPDPTVQRLAPKLVDALDRAINYSQSVLAYGRVQNQPPNPRQINLHRLCEETAEMLGLFDHLKGIEWHNRISEDIELIADPDQIFRVLTNLVRNAVEAMAQPETHDISVVKRITARCEVGENVIRICIDDTGPGVPEKARQNLFRPFKGSARSGGTGLGLAIAAELVGAHGGAIRLEDTNIGACFCIELPIDQTVAAFQSE